MASTLIGRKRIRKFFGKLQEVAEMPNLIEVQKASYDQFLMVEEPAGGRPEEGLQAVFKSVFPISDFSSTALLEFVKYTFEPPKYDVDECRQRGMTFAAPLKVTLRLIVFDVDPDTGAKSVKDIKEQDVYMGDMPLMTDNGTFIVNGTERVIVSQMHRSPGVFFDHDKGKTHSSGKLLFAARIIPYRGSWLDIEFDAKDIVHARIDRKRKIPVTSLLYALGLDGEEILRTFYDRIAYARDGDGWRVPFDAERMKGFKATVDLDRRRHRRGRARGRQEAHRPHRPPALREGPQVPARDGRGPRRPVHRRGPRQPARRARSTPRPATRSPRRCCARSPMSASTRSRCSTSTTSMSVPTSATRSRSTRTTRREDALFDIYRVMRPGEPPTIDTAEAMFRSLFFDPGALRPLRGRPREDEHAPRPRRRGHRAHAAPRGHARGGEGARRPARRQGRDRRHRPPRQPPRPLGRRAHGEPVPPGAAAHGARHQGAHVLRRHRHGDAAGPDQRQAGGGGGARVLRLVASSRSSWTRPTRSRR